MEDAMTLREFCRRNKISRSHWYRILEEGKAPRFFRSGKKILITPQAAAAWREELESEQAKQERAS